MALCTGKRPFLSYADNFSWERVLKGPDTGENMMYCELAHRFLPSPLSPIFFAWRKDGVSHTEPTLDVFSYSDEKLPYLYKRKEQPELACLIGGMDLGDSFLINIVQWPEGFGNLYLRPLTSESLWVASPFGVFQWKKGETLSIGPGATENRIGDTLNRSLYERLEREYSSDGWGTIFL